MKTKYIRIKSKLKILIWEYTVATSYLVKRLLDIFVSLTLLVVLFPFFIILGIIIKIDSPGPVIYKSKRVGRYGKYFTFLKFRSMRVDAESSKNDILKNNESTDGVIFKMKSDPRVTRVGRFIRKTSIDELPQLLNVLEGAMSLVGPRPPLPIEVAQYTLDERKRLHVKPGITCIWQISGRSDIPFKQQVKLDEQYIKSNGILGDIAILLKTIPAILTGRGAY